MPDSETDEAPLLTSADFTIPPNFRPEDYITDWQPRLTSIDEYNDFEERNKVFEKFYNFIYNLLLGKNATQETREQAIKFLEVQRSDACYFNPFMYNDWIRTVKDEIIKQELYDLWLSGFVGKQLGLIYAMESDYFDDMDDPEPAEFYKLPVDLLLNKMTI